MASAFGHSLFAFTLVKSTYWKKPSAKLLFLSIVSSILPDADVIAFRLGIPYEDIYGHRGITHSLLFAGVWSLLVTLIFFSKKNRSIPIYFILLISTVSHGILDAMTTGGRGVGFFIPFNNKRYFFPFRPIEVSPIKVTRFFEQAQQILWSEFLWIGIPCLGILFMNGIIRAVFRKRLNQNGKDLDLGPKTFS